MLFMCTDKTDIYRDVSFINRKVESDYNGKLADAVSSQE